MPSKVNYMQLLKLCFRLLPCKLQSPKHFIQDNNVVKIEYLKVHLRKSWSQIIIPRIFNVIFIVIVVFWNSQDREWNFLLELTCHYNDD